MRGSRMIYIDISILTGCFLLIVLTVAITGSFVISKKNSIEKRVPRLAKRECLTCTKTFHIAVVTQFWKCPFCGSINKEYKNDY